MNDELAIGSETICAGYGDYRKKYFLGRKGDFGFVDSLSKDELELVIKTLREHKQEIAERNALIKGLASALEKEVRFNHVNDCRYANQCCCDDCDYKYCAHKTYAETLAKARKVLSDE